MQWKHDATDPVGPRQYKLVEAAMNALGREHNTHVKLLGVRGVDVTEHVLWSPFGVNTREDVKAAQTEIGERFAWTLSKANHKAVIDAFTAAIIEAKKHRRVENKTQSPEEAAEARQRYEEAEAKRRAEYEARKAAEAAAVPASARPVVTYNARKNGLEIKFPSRPSDEVLNRLRNGRSWHWSPRFKVWWRKASLEGVDSAAAIAGLPAEETAKLRDQVLAGNPPAPMPDRFDQDVEDQMAAACGV